MEIKRSGWQPSAKGPADYFTGTVRIDAPFSGEDPARVGGATVINELPFHTKKALENGVTRDQIIETITHLAFYAGWPPAMTALQIVRKVFEETGK